MVKSPHFIESTRIFVGLIFFSSVITSHLGFARSQLTEITPQSTLPQDKVAALRKAVEALPQLSFKTRCRPQDEEAYKFIANLADENRDQDLVDLETIPHPNILYLSNRLEQIKQVNKGRAEAAEGLESGILCSLDKGIVCDSQTAFCNCLNNKGIFSTSFNSKTMSCVFDSNVKCGSGHPETCAPPFECYLDSGDRVPDEQDHLTECTEANRWALSLNDDYPCTCKSSNAVRLAEMRSLQDELVSMPYLDYGAPCKVDLHEYLFDKGGLVDSVVNHVPDFYSSKKYADLVQVYIDWTGKALPRPVFCDMRKAFFCKRETEKCDCFLPAIYNLGRKECILPKLSPCPGESNPYNCEDGTHCLFRDIDVLCNDENKKDIKENRLEVSSSCFCSSNKHTSKFTKNLIRDLSIKTKEAVGQEIKELSKSLWTVVPYGESCLWSDDRLYFEMQDFIFARKEKVYYDMHNFKQLKAKSTAAGFKPFKVCDLTKFMRCGFLSEKCECPITRYFSEVIGSAYDPGTKSCALLRGSRCHSSLSDWLPCQKGEVCAYEAVPVLCNRRNKNVAIEKGLRFQTAACSCSPQPIKADFDEELIRKYSVTRRFEEEKCSGCDLVQLGVQLLE